jgi:MFS transporter, FHS family, glucose/mannose:H+ symporter
MAINRRRSLWLFTAGTFFAFFLFGFSDNLKGPTLPALLSDLRFNYSQGGTLLLAAYVGFLVATLLTSVLADVAGKKAVLLVAGACLLVGMGAYSLSSSFWLLAAAMAILGLGLGSLEVGGNNIIVDLHAEQKGRFLNLLGTFHGLGSFVAPFLAGQLLKASLSWRQVYQIGLIPVVVLLLYLVFLRYPGGAASGADRLDWGSLGRSIFSKKMAWFYLLVTIYVAAEVGLASWLVEFLQKEKGQTNEFGSTLLSLFFLGIMIGRFLGSFVVERIGYLKSLLIVSVASLVCLGFGIFGPPACIFCLPLTGLFFSIVFPTTTAAVSDFQKEKASTALGLFFAFAGLGGMIGPWLMGLFSDWRGLTFGFSLVPVYCAVMLGSVLMLMKDKTLS